MLNLDRTPGQIIYIGEDIKITLVSIVGHSARVGIDAPRDVNIVRGEIKGREPRRVEREEDDSFGNR